MKEDLAQLLRKADESVRAAEVLLQHSMPGFAASRAYYAMFYGAEALLLSKGLASSTHSGVIAAFGEHFAKPRLLDPTWHRHLMAAFEDRHVGDYAVGQTITPEEAQLQIDRAKAFLQAARQWLRQ